MRKLTDNALRARNLLSREKSPLSPECERVVVRDLERTLSGYFKLSGRITLKVERGKKLSVTIQAEADEVKPFGIVT